MENALASLVACSSIHIIGFLSERKKKLDDFSINAFAETNEKPPRGFTGTGIEYNFKGRELNERTVEEARKILERKYWSVGSMLRESIKIKSKYSIAKE